MGKVQSLLRERIGSWHDVPWRSKTPRDLVQASAAAAVGAWSLVYLYNKHAVNRVHDAYLLLQTATGLVFLWARTDARLDARSAASVASRSPEQHDEAVAKFVRRVKQDGLAASAKDNAVRSKGHDESNSFGRPSVHAMPRFNGHACIAIRDGSSRPGDVPVIVVEPGMSMDQLFAATVARSVSTMLLLPDVAAVPANLAAQR